MLVCFNCPPHVKAILHRLVLASHYSDIGEAIVVAIENLHALHEAAGADQVVIVPESKGTVKPAATAIVEPSRLSQLPQICGVPNRPAPSTVVELAGANPTVETTEVDEWIWGQFNKFLPLKMVLRTAAKLSLDTAGALALDDLRAIAVDASVEVGSLLSAHDALHGLDRDAALSHGFPTNQGDIEKSKRRFLEQFVGYFNGKGLPSGMAFSFRLLVPVANQPGCVTLTRPGWAFAALANPALDDRQAKPTERFSREEKDLLLEHIRAHVPEEYSSFSSLASAVMAGETTPSGIDEWLVNNVGGSNHRELTSAVVATQRIGAISRMIELGLLERQRLGANVSYRLTKTGIQFTSNER